MCLCSSLATSQQVSHNFTTNCMSNPDVGFIHTEKDFAYIIILLFDSL